MKLADAVRYVTVTDGRIQEEDFQPLECSLQVELTDACEDDAPERFLVDGAGIGVNTAWPFLIRATGDVPAACAPDDYAAFIGRAVGQAVDFGVARALTTPPPADGAYGADQVWLGKDGVSAVAFTGDALRADAVGFVDAIAEARTLWHTRVVGEEPVLHVSPAALPGLQRSGGIRWDGAEPVTAWVDPVVYHVGYDPLPGAPRRPVAFWAPLGFEVQRGEVEAPNDPFGLARGTNRQKYIASVPVKIAVAPCAIVRVDTTLA
jgi:hypothetical protein